MKKLSFSDVQYILEKMPLDQEIKAKIQESSVCLKLDEDEVSVLRDLCGERLQTEGFDEAYNLTAEGIILEDLVDKLHE